MDKIVFMTYGHSPALAHARNQLESWGYAITQDSRRATHVLLPVPSFEENGNVKGAGALPAFDKRVWILGGNLPKDDPSMLDLLQDEFYLRENAAITAHCAMTRLERSEGKQVLILGLGRIGRVLGKLLQEQGARVTLAVRSEEKKMLSERMGFDAVLCQELQPRKYDAIFNTAPAFMMDQQDAKEDALLVDLASVRGITGDRVDWARALPGREAPQQSGTLIAKTALRYALEREEGR